MENTITLGQKFTLQLDTNKERLDDVRNFLTENKYEFDIIQRSYSSFVEIYVKKVNIRKAEVIRQLLKNLIVC